MSQKSVVNILNGNIIQRFEELYGVKEKFLNGIKILPNCYIDCEFKGDVFAPHVANDGVTIKIHADYVSFLWGFIYGSWVQYEEDFMKEELICQGVSLSRDVTLIQRAREVLDMSLKNRAYPCPEGFPSPNSGNSANERFYVERVNGIFLDALCILLFHEVCHIESGHFGKLNGFCSEKRIQCEKECDSYALRMVFRNFNESNPKQFNTSMLATVHAFASMMFLLKDPLLLNQTNHPNLDDRLQNMIDKLDIQGNHHKYYIYKYADVLVRHFRKCHQDVYDFMKIDFENKPVETAQDLFYTDLGGCIERLKFPVILFSPDRLGRNAQYASRKIHGYLSDVDLASNDNGKINFVAVENIPGFDENKSFFLYARGMFYTICRNDSRYYQNLYRKCEKKSFYYYLVDETPENLVPVSIKDHPSIDMLKENPYNKELSTNCYSENILNDTSITAVFSCPGRCEERANRPCKGMTGKSLDYILKKIHFGGISLNRSLIGINNAWDKIEYTAKTKRSEASDEEILENSNIERLNYELRYTNVAIAFGDKAFLALDYIKKNYRRNLIVVKVIHLSPRKVNTSIKKDMFGNDLVKGAKGNLKKRLCVVAENIKNASGGVFS